MSKIQTIGIDYDIMKTAPCCGSNQVWHIIKNTEKHYACCKNCGQSFEYHLEQQKKGIFFIVFNPTDKLKSKNVLRG